MIYHFNEVPIFYEVTGEGPHMLLLHGFLESSTIWSTIVSELSRDNTMVTLDLPGHGKSGCIAETHSMELMAEVVYSLLKYLKIKSASFVGHSMGGYVALAFAEKYEHKIGSLVLLNSTTKTDSAVRKRNRERALKIISVNKRAFINMAFAHMFVESSRERYASEFDSLTKEAFTFPTEGIIAMIRGMKERKDRARILENFRRDKYVICGEEDPVVPITVSKEIALTTHSKLIILQGGHMSWLENKDEIVKFLHFIE